MIDLFLSWVAAGAGFVVGAFVALCLVAAAVMALAAASGAVEGFIETRRLLDGRRLPPVEPPEDERVGG